MIREAIGQVMSGRALEFGQAAQVMAEIMEGQATPAQVGGFLVALRLKGETVEEVAGLASVMRQKAQRVEVSVPTVDTCGTGGDGSGTFNVSTAVAFVLAGAGVHVAKHGNRAASSQCGSADVLEALGVRIDLPPQEAAACLGEVGIAFLLATVYHPSMKHVAGPRRELGVRTVFNILGPLTNPAGARRQLLGVPDSALVEKMGEALQVLGCDHVLVVHGEDGVDELSISGPSVVCEIESGSRRTYLVTPEQFGLARAERSAIRGGTAAENAMLLRGVLGGELGPRRDIVLLNAGAAFVAADRVRDIREGIQLAAVTIDDGRALAALDRLVQVSQALGKVTA